MPCWDRNSSPHLAATHVLVMQGQAENKAENDGGDDSANGAVVHSGLSQI
jgi:hypothetical protein